jgi:hypothetical protein
MAASQASVWVNSSPAILAIAHSADGAGDRAKAIEYYAGTDGQEVHEAKAFLASK